MIERMVTSGERDGKNGKTVKLVSRTDLLAAIADLAELLDRHGPETLTEADPPVCVRCIEVWPCRESLAIRGVVRAAGL